MSDSSILRASTFARYLDEDGLETLANRIEEVYVKKGEEGSRPIPATYDEPTALYAHAVGDIIYMNGHFYKVTVAIAVNDSIVVGTNVTDNTGIDPGTNVMVDKLPGNVARQIMATDVVVDNTGTSLNSTTAQGAIVELDSSKQAVTDNSLNTTSKTVPGAINELNASLASPTIVSSFGVIPNTTYLQVVNGSPTTAIRGYKYSNGVKIISEYLAVLAQAPWNTTVMTIPEGFRPVRDLRIPYANSQSWLVLRTDGTVITDGVALEANQNIVFYIVYV